MEKYNFTPIPEYVNPEIVIICFVAIILLIIFVIIVMWMVYLKLKKKGLIKERTNKFRKYKMKEIEKLQWGLSFFIFFLWIFFFLDLAILFSGFGYFEFPLSESFTNPIIFLIAVSGFTLIIIIATICIEMVMWEIKEKIQNETCIKQREIKE